MYRNYLQYVSLALRLTWEVATLHFLQVMSSDRVSLVSSRAGSSADSVRLHIFLEYHKSIASLVIQSSHHGVTAFYKSK